MTNFCVKGPCCPHVSPRTLHIRHVFSVAGLLIMMWRQKVGQCIFILKTQPSLYPSCHLFRSRPLSSSLT